MVPYAYLILVNVFFLVWLADVHGNRGKCAGPCRLPYELLENDKVINSGYLLSLGDLYGLEYLPFLIKCGVKSFKIEGRMKSPEYVATVTRIYRKYIDLAYSGKDYIIDENDKKDLLQVFNRGMSSSGHLGKDPNKNLVYKENPSNQGLFLGIVQNYNKNKGHITLKPQEQISVGDTIAFENEDCQYTISELMNQNHNNISDVEINKIAIIGRMKGNIKPGDKIYKMSSKNLLNLSKQSYSKENRKVFLDCTVTIKRNQPISINIKSNNSEIDLYNNLDVTYSSDFLPQDAINRPLDELTVINQISKTASTMYEFKNIKVDLDENVFIPKLSILNELRRNALIEVENYAIKHIKRECNVDINANMNIGESIDINENKDIIEKDLSSKSKPAKISVLLNILHLDFDYSKLENIDNVYIPLKYFTKKEYSSILETISKKFDTYICMPTIIKVNYRNLIYSNVENAITKYNIKGFIFSNISNIQFLEEILKDRKDKFQIIANFTFNVFNNNSIEELKKLGINRFTISPELDKKTICELSLNKYLPTELIVYGRTPLVNMNYCLLRRV